MSYCFILMIIFPSVDSIRFNSIDENSTNSNEIMKILVGTKRKYSKREVSLEKAEGLADHLGVSYKEICFENQKNIRELFETLAGLTVLLYQENDFHSEIQMILPHDSKKKTSFCACGWLPSCLSVCLSLIHTLRMLSQWCDLFECSRPYYGFKLYFTQL